jgi:hypothetical protein
VQINQFIVSQHSVPDSIGACRKKSSSAPWNGHKNWMPQRRMETVAPSAIPFQDTDTIPVALDKSGIEK